MARAIAAWWPRSTVHTASDAGSSNSTRSASADARRSQETATVRTGSDRLGRWSVGRSERQRPPRVALDQVRRARRCGGHDDPLRLLRQVLHQRCEARLVVPALRPGEHDSDDGVHAECRPPVQGESRIGRGDQQVHSLAPQAPHRSRGAVRHLNPQIRVGRQGVGLAAPLLQLGGRGQQQRVPALPQPAQQTGEGGDGVDRGGWRDEDQIVSARDRRHRFPHGGVVRTPAQSRQRLGDGRRQVEGFGSRHMASAGSRTRTRPERRAS